MMCLLADNLALSAGDTLLMVVPACHANACALPLSELPKLRWMQVHTGRSVPTLVCTAALLTLLTF